MIYIYKYTIYYTIYYILPIKYITHGNVTSFPYTVERGKLPPKDIIITESGTLEPEEERMFTVSVPLLVSLYFTQF